jgi:hypothetical protein
VQVADRDHVFFEYARKETSATLVEMFAGYAGYIQADAKSVYDVLFRERKRNYLTPAIPASTWSAGRVRPGRTAHRLTQGLDRL